MKLLNRLLKTKKPDENTIGSMWLCAANFDRDLEEYVQARIAAAKGE